MTNLAPENLEAWPLDEEREFWRAKCAEKLWWFGQIAQGAAFYIEANPKDAGTISLTIHKPAVEWLEGHLKEWLFWRSKGVKRMKKLAIIWPRFFRKTLWVTRWSNPWCHLHDRDMSTAIGSEDATRAAQFLTSIKKVYEQDNPYAWFSWLYGNWYDRDRAWVKTEMNHAFRENLDQLEKSFSIWSVRSGLTGLHPDRIDFDDPISEEKINEEGNWIEQVNRAYDAATYAFRSDSLVILTGTRYRDDDLLKTVLKEEMACSWTGFPNQDDEILIDPKEGSWDVYLLEAEDPDTRESICPAIITTKQLREKERKNPIIYAAQMLNRPTAGEHMPITKVQLNQCYVTRAQYSDEFWRNMRYKIHVDTAFKSLTRRRQGDESACAVSGQPADGSGDVFYIEGFSDLEYRDEDFTGDVVKLIQRYLTLGYHIDLITKERVGEEEVWFEYLRTICVAAGILRPECMDIPRGHKRKDDRIRERFGYWVSGHCRIIRGAPDEDKLTTQSLGFGFMRRKDLLDAFMDAFDPKVYTQIRPKGRSVIDSHPVSPGDEELTGISIESRPGSRFTSRDYIDTIEDDGDEGPW